MRRLIPPEYRIWEGLVAIKWSEELESRRIVESKAVNSYWAKHHPEILDIPTTNHTKEFTKELVEYIEKFLKSKGFTKKVSLYARYKGKTYWIFGKDD